MAHMAHIHVAIFKWKEGTNRDEIDRALELVRQVADRVQGIKAIYCGHNTSRWAQGFTDAVVVVGESADAIQRYRDDDVHTEAARLIEAMELDGIGVDFADPAN